MKKTTLGLLIVFLLVLVTGNVYSFQKNEQTPELERTTIHVNYINVHTVYEILLPFKSPYGKIQVLRDSNMLIIEDKPEFVKKILSILKEIDVKPVDIQFTVDLVLASKSKNASFEPDKNLQSDPLIKELMSMLNYQSFKRIDTSLIRVQDNTSSSQRIGGSGIGLRIALQPRYYKEESKNLFHVDLRLRQYETTSEIGNTDKSYSLKNPIILIDTSLSIQSGERSVVGVSKLDGGDLGLILIIEGKIIK
jgi:hypothetical protein